MAKEITIYTDGGCSGNPGPGGWGAIILDGANEAQISGGEPHTTNNRMELLAAINALEFVRQNYDAQNASVKFFIDSQYVKNGITVWIKNWKAKGWRTSDKKPVKNTDLWTQLDSLVSLFSALEWNWVKGHSGIKYNEICDALCQKEIRLQSAQ